MPQRAPREEDAARRSHLGVVALEEDGRAAVRDHGIPAYHLEPRLLEHGRAVRLVSTKYKVQSTKYKHVGEHE